MLMDVAAKAAFETRILETINGWAGHYPALDNLARLVAVFGVLPLVAGAVLIAVCSDQKWRRWGGWVTLISVVPAVYAMSRLSEFMTRPTPFLCHPIRLLLCTVEAVSHPSFGMGAAAALAFGLFAYGGKWRWLPLPYLAIVGIARVFCGLEYPLDQAWAVIGGSSAALCVVLALNPRYVFLKEDGWPVTAMGTCVVLAGVFLFAHTPEPSLPPQQSTCRVAAPIVSAEEKNLIRGMSPVVERKIAAALLKLKMPGRIRRVGVGVGESTSVAAVKFDAGPDAKPMARPVIESEALAVIHTTLAEAPEVSQVDVFAVTTWDREGRQVLSVAYSVSARRKDAGFLFSKTSAKLSTAQALSRFGMIFYRVHRGAE